MRKRKRVKQPHAADEDSRNCLGTIPWSLRWNHRPKRNETYCPKKTRTPSIKRAIGWRTAVGTWQKRGSQHKWHGFSKDEKSLKTFFREKKGHTKGPGAGMKAITELGKGC